VYTGGTPNMSAIGMALEVSNETFIVLNTSDVILGSLYLFFILGFGKNIIKKFLLPFDKKDGEQLEATLETQKCLKDMSLAFLLAISIVGISAGASLLLFKKLELPVVLLGLTALGMLASLNLKIRALKGS